MGVSFLSAICDINYVVWGNIAGFSLVTDVLFFYVFYYGKYCILTRLLPVGMFLINLLNIYGYFNHKNYNAWYEVLIFSVILSLAIIYELKKIISK